MRVLISNPTIVNNGEQFQGSIVVNNGKITEILRGNELPRAECDKIIEAAGLYLIPGVIDDHVHFREPGLTQKATIATESRAAAAGGVTSYMEMPNTVPQTTTLKALKEKYAIAAKDSLINYSFFFGATNNNVADFEKLNPQKTCGIKLFMGSSTGNMLVDKREQLEKIFSTAKQLGLPVGRLVCASNAPNGSSIKSTSGLLASVLAIATRCFIPPESCLGSAFSNPSKPTSLMYSLAIAVRSSVGTFFIFNPNSTFF